VETSLAQSVAAHDPWEWFLRVLCAKYPQAFTPAPPYSARGVPTQGFAFQLLVCLTRDSRWLHSPDVPASLPRFMGARARVDVRRRAGRRRPTEIEEEREAFWRSARGGAAATVAEGEDVFRATRTSGRNASARRRRR
jgi:hypothetical protein